MRKTLLRPDVMRRETTNDDQDVTENVALPPPPTEGAGAEEWLELVDQALQGLHHALNNRLGSLSALVELFQLGDLTADLAQGGGSTEASFRSLAADLARLEDCSRMVRLLPRDAVAIEEPLILDDVLADVFAIHRFLHDVRDLQVSIAPTRYVEPVRVERWALVRVLALLLNDAKRLAKQADAIVRVVTESDEHWVQIEFRVGSPLVTDVPSPAHAGGRYAALVAAGFGGTVNRRQGVVELRLPTLRARRAADR